ncbi:MAG: phage holin family protein [Caldilineae bacterium]|nr:MAG: phage holin family protein [Caldilineae bacterium]
MTGLITRLIVNAVALGVTAWVVPGIDYGNISSLLIVAVIFGVVNALIKPVLRLLTCPLIAITLGLFTLVINALMLWLTGWVAELVGVQFTVNGFVPAVLGAIVLWIIGVVLNIFVD